MRNNYLEVIESGRVNIDTESEGWVSKAFAMLKNSKTFTERYEDVTSRNLYKLGMYLEVWEQLEKDKMHGELHYIPSDPEDMKGLTEGFQINYDNHGTEIQFDARSMEHAAVVTFGLEELPEGFLKEYLVDRVKYNSLGHAISTLGVSYKKETFTVEKDSLPLVDKSGSLVKEGSRWVIGTDLKDHTGNKAMLISKSDSDGNYRKVKQGEIITIEYNAADIRACRFNPYSGIEINARVFSSSNVQSAREYEIESYKKGKGYPRIKKESSIEVSKGMGM